MDKHRLCTATLLGINGYKTDERWNIKRICVQWLSRLTTRKGVSVPNFDESCDRGRTDHDFFNNMSLKERQNWAKGIVNRLMIASKVSEKKGLAELIGCHQNMPSNWVQKGSVPWKVIYTCHLETGVSLDWLYDGVEPQVKVSGHVRYKMETLATEVMQLGQRMELIKQTGTEGFKLVSRIIIKDVIGLLSPNTKNDSK